MAGLVRTRPPDPGVALPRRAQRFLPSSLLLACGGLLACAPRRCPAARPSRRAGRRRKNPRSTIERDKSGQKQMLVQAREINYDYTNHRVAAVGNVQIYYGGSTLEADGSSTTRPPSACTPKAMSG